MKHELGWIAQIECIKGATKFCFVCCMTMVLILPASQAILKDKDGESALDHSVIWEKSQVTQLLLDTGQYSIKTLERLAKRSVVTERVVSLKIVLSHLYRNLSDDKMNRSFLRQMAELSDDEHKFLLTEVFMKISSEEGLLE